MHEGYEFTVKGVSGLRISSLQVRRGPGPEARPDEEQSGAPVEAAQGEARKPEPDSAGQDQAEPRPEPKEARDGMDD
jgi:hypothetical protein